MQNDCCLSAVQSIQSVLFLNDLFELSLPSGEPFFMFALDRTGGYVRSC